MIPRRAGPLGFTAVMMCAAILVSAGTLRADGWFTAQLSFDVTVADGASQRTAWFYTYTVSIPDLEQGTPDIAEPVRSFAITGAFDIDPATITQVGGGGYEWYPGEIVYPGNSPSHDAGLQNPTPSPVIWWIRSSLIGSGTAAGTIATFSFVSTSPPKVARLWVAHSQNLLQADGEVVGPTPELPPLLLLGQSAPILGWLGYRRRRRS